MIIQQLKCKKCGKIFTENEKPRIHKIYVPYEGVVEILNHNRLRGHQVAQFNFNWKPRR